MSYISVKLNLNRYSSVQTSQGNLASSKDFLPKTPRFQGAKLSGQNLGVEAFLNTLAKEDTEKITETLVTNNKLHTEKV